MRIEILQKLKHIQRSLFITVCMSFSRNGLYIKWRNMCKGHFMLIFLKISTSSLVWASLVRLKCVYLDGSILMLSLYIH